MWTSPRARVREVQARRELFPHRAVEPLQQAGHAVLTVTDEHLAGADDRAVIGAARAEDRCLVTLDREFGNPLLFNPAEYKGIVVLRLPPRASLQHLVHGVETLLRGLGDSQLDGKLWIIDRGRIREYQPEQ